MSKPTYAFTLVFCLVSSIGFGELQVLHRSNTSPEQQEGRIVATAFDGTNIYGLTDTGNGNNYFSLDRVTREFALTSLPTQPEQRMFPPQKSGPLVLVGDLLVGSFSPSNSDIFTLRLDGTGFRVIAEAEDIGLQFPNVSVANGQIFGSTERGVFRLQPDGTDVRTFRGEIESPASAPLAFDGARLFGATWPSFGFTPGEELDGVGMIYSVNPDGTDFRVLRDTGIASISSLSVQAGTIYGLEDTLEGTRIGPEGPLAGNLFSIGTDGTNYRVLHEFQGGPADGQNASRVVTNGDQLFGVTRTGGTENAGTIFRSNLDGSDYEIIHRFGAGPFNGVFPNSDLVVIGSSLYGSTLEGGAFDATQPLGGGGIVYSIETDANAVPEPTSSLVWLTLIGVTAFAARVREATDSHAKRS